MTAGLKIKTEYKLRSIFGSQYQKAIISINQYDIAMKNGDYFRASSIARSLESYFFSESMEREYREWRTKAAYADKLREEIIFKRYRNENPPVW